MTDYVPFKPGQFASFNRIEGVMRDKFPDDYLISAVEDVHQDLYRQMGPQWVRLLINGRPQVVSCKIIDLSYDPEPCVAMGAALFDKIFNRPITKGLPNWTAEINVDELNMSNRCDCVGGQLFTDYELALEELRFEEADAIKHGLDVPSEPAATEMDRYAQLEKVWKRFITERRAALAA